MNGRWFGPALLVGLMVCSPLVAGDIVVGGGGGTEDPPDPTEGAETEENWNPVINCVVPPGGTILDLLLCLEDEIENPPPACPQTPGGSGGGGGPVEFDEDPPDCHTYPNARSDFNVDVLSPPAFPHYGLRILRLDGSEIERVAFRENDPGIQTTQLTINRPNLMALYGLIDEAPAGQGSVILKVDSHAIAVATSGRTASQINKILQINLQALGYTLTVEGTRVAIHNQQGLSPGVRLIQWRSTDPGIRRSNLELRPDEPLEFVPLEQ